MQEIKLTIGPKQQSITKVKEHRLGQWRNTKRGSERLEDKARAE